jgi:hypothetical protein
MQASGIKVIHIEAAIIFGLISAAQITRQTGVI